MSTALHRAMTLEEFLAWEDRQERKHEFDGFEPVAMAGGTEAHLILQRNLAIRFGGRLLDRRGPCRFLGADARLVTGLGTSRYPDGMITCTPPDPRRTTQHDPLVVFEVLSDSTAATDRTRKAREYHATPSIQRYVMLEQTSIAATIYTRTAEGPWSVTLLLGDDLLALPEAGLDPVPLAELYAELDFAEPAA